MKLKNFILSLKEQGPFGRFFKNFFITRNGWGLFSKYSHINKNGKEKISYKRSSAIWAAKQMEKKYGYHYSVYKCMFCDGYHIGKNRTSVTNVNSMKKTSTLQ